MEAYTENKELDPYGLASFSEMLLTKEGKDNVCMVKLKAGA